MQPDSDYASRVNNLKRIALALIGLAFSSVSLADTIHEMENGAYYHHQSGWIFPAQIGDFSLVGAPQDINGTVDVVAYYARVSKGVRTVASVSVYPPDSAEPETTPASIKATPVAVEVSKQPPLRAARLTYKDGRPREPSCTSSIRDLGSSRSVHRYPRRTKTALPSSRNSRAVSDGTACNPRPLLETDARSGAHRYRDFRGPAPATRKFIRRELDGLAIA